MRIINHSELFIFNEFNILYKECKIKITIFVDDNNYFKFNIKAIGIGGVVLSNKDISLFELFDYDSFIMDIINKINRKPINPNKMKYDTLILKGNMEFIINILSNISDLLIEDIKFYSSITKYDKYCRLSIKSGNIENVITLYKIPTFKDYSHRYYITKDSTFNIYDNSKSKKIIPTTRLNILE